MAFFRLARKGTFGMLAALAAVLFLAAGPDDAATRREALATCAPEVVDTAALEQMLAPDPAQRALTEYLSRRYYIAAEATERMVGAAFSAARQVGLDPLLVLAVISVESRFNPIAESVMGAKGLMQIIPRYHAAKFRPFGGEDAVLDPESNIRVGAQILQEYVYRTGTLEAGLQTYNGALRDESGQYALKVMAERERLEQVVRTALGSKRSS
jgi:soluble lytic murein transglycosylase-like protein